ncbi:type II toxin-antitoxin system RelE/ParE family toxin [bacterium]|nr:type II toxin-antitoxin system RelE/ParE family toxin [bacterium]
MRLVVAPTAREEVVEAWHFIARDNVDAADGWVNRLGKEYDKLRKYPHIGRVRWESHPTLRCWPFGSYLIFYRVSGNTLTILRVVSDYRDISESEFGEI